MPASASPEPLPEKGVSRIFLWVGGKDKAAAKAAKALKESLSPVSILTMKKLPKDRPLVDLRPDIAEKRLLDAFGQGVTVTRTTVLDEEADSVWRQLRMYPAGDAALLKKLDGIHSADAGRVQLLEGSSGQLRLWSHMVRLESLGEDGTICTDQVEFDAGKLNCIYKPLAGAFLKREQRRRARALKKGKHAL